MQNFLDKLRSTMQSFMSGRYGGDQLGILLVVVSLILSVLGNWAGRWMYLVALLVLALAFARILSSNRAARQKENQAFLASIAKPYAWMRRQHIKFVNRKTKAYVRCPHCNTEFALPKGKGHLRATCPKCGEKSEHMV